MFNLFCVQIIAHTPDGTHFFVFTKLKELNERNSSDLCKGVLSERPTGHKPTDKGFGNPSERKISQSREYL